MQPGRGIYDHGHELVTTAWLARSTNWYKTPRKTRVLLKAGPWPKAHFTARGPAARRPTARGPRHTVHIPRSSLEFWSAVFYSACSDLCSKMEEGEFWFLCNFNRFNPLQSLLQSFCCFLLKEETLDPYCIGVYTLQLCTGRPKPLILYPQTRRCACPIFSYGGPCADFNYKYMCSYIHVLNKWKKTLQLPFPKMRFSNLSNLCSTSLFVQSSRIIGELVLMMKCW